MSTQFTCVICNITQNGGRTRKICKDCNKIPRYCVCGCGTQLKSVFTVPIFTRGHNIYFESDELKRERTLKAKLALGNRIRKPKLVVTKTFICKRCNIRKEGHPNTKFCNECVTTPYKCNCSVECTIMIHAGGDRKDGFYFPKFASKHGFRTFVCIRCDETKVCGNTGRLREVCDDCQNKLNPCKDNCGGFVKAGRYNHEFISGHNLSLFPYEEMRRRGQKTIELRMKNGTYGSRHSKGERSLKPYLEPLGFIHSEDKSLCISNGFKNRYPDYYNSNNKQIIEYFGTYWHRDRVLKKGKKHKTPQEVISWYQKQGWDCTIVWEDQVEEFINNLVKS